MPENAVKITNAAKRFPIIDAFKRPEAPDGLVVVVEGVVLVVDELLVEEAVVAGLLVEEAVVAGLLVEVDVGRVVVDVCRVLVEVLGVVDV